MTPTKKKIVPRGSTRKRSDEKRAEAIVSRIRRDRAIFRVAADRGFTTPEAAMVELLCSSEDAEADYSDFRGHFPHRLSSANQDVLAKVRALFGLLVDALQDNDAAALHQAAGLWSALLGLGSDNDRISSALKLLEGTIGGPLEAQPEFLILMLGAIEPEYRALRPERVQDVLRLVKTDGAKGGRGNLSAVGALERLRGDVGLSGGRKKIDNATARQARTLSKPKRSPRAR